jgi:hypothetical protein
MGKMRKDPTNLNPVITELRAACRSNPDSAQYWNDLAVAEMRSGAHEKAHLHFTNALKADPKHTLALKNMKTLTNVYQSPTNFENTQVSSSSTGMQAAADWWPACPLLLCRLRPDPRVLPACPPRSLLPLR